MLKWGKTRHGIKDWDSEGGKWKQAPTDARLWVDMRAIHPSKAWTGGASLINTEAERWDGVGWIEYCSLAAGLGGISSEWDEDGDDGG